MRYLIPLLFPLFLFAETTDNLLNQTYFNGTTPINGWSGTNDHNHGGSIIAGVHGEYLENTITLGDTLNQSQMNGGWTSTFGSDIWHWNDYQSTVKMTQTITGADGSVTTQVRDVVSSPCGGSNCGSYVTYTDSYTQGINNQSNFNIKVRYDFSDTSQSSSHWSPDIKNPTLIIEHSLLSVEQQSTISEINETIDETIQQQVETVEFIPIEEFTFEVYEEPVIQVFEEIYIEEIAQEEINIGTVNVFNEIPMEVSYEEPTTIETFSTEIQSFEENIETRESFNNTPTGEVIQEIFSEEVYETQNVETSIEREPIREETSIGSSTVVAERPEESSSIEAETRESNEPTSRENEEGVSTESNSSSETNTAEASSNETTAENSNISSESETVSNSNSTESTTVAEEEVTDETVGEGETTDSESGNGGTETVASREDALESRDNEVEESRDSGNTTVNTETISIEAIEKKVNETLKRVDQRLIATSLIVARAMESPLSMDNYGQINNNIFINQLNIDGGNYNDQREYVDLRDIYAENQSVYNDSMAQRQTNIQKNIDEVIRTQEHLRRIRGY
jgi:hypothetical protein